MEDFFRRLRNWNMKMNDIPRRLLLIALVLCACFVLVKLFPLCWPFVLALIFAMLMEPLVRLLRRAFVKISIGDRLATILGMILVFGLLGLGVRALAGRLLQELGALARNTPTLLRFISDQVTGWVASLTQQYADVVPQNLVEITTSALSEINKTLVSLAGTVSKTIASGAWTTATSVPSMLLAIVLTIMGTYYMSSDRERIFAFFHRTFPAGMIRKGVLLKRDLFRALFGQIRAQLLVSLLITVVVLLGLLIQQKPYWLLLGLLIGMADALPVLGAGLFLIPWSLIGFVTSDTATGVGMALLYVAVVVTRQIAEPRIVGKSLGLYPLATMMAMFAGYQFTGNVLGLLLGPVLLNLLKVVLQADRGVEAPPVVPKLNTTFKRKAKMDAPKDSPKAAGQK